MTGTTRINRAFPSLIGGPIFAAIAWLILNSAQTAYAATPPTGTTSNLIAHAQQQAQANAIDPTIFVRQITQESGFNPNAYNASSGATGVAQIVTRYHAGVNPADPYASLAYAAQLDAQYLRRFGGRYDLMLAAYNAGPDAVAASQCVPAIPETQQYVHAIFGGTALPWTPSTSGASTGSSVAIPQILVGSATATPTSGAPVTRADHTQSGRSGSPIGGGPSLTLGPIGAARHPFHPKLARDG